MVVKPDAIVTINGMKLCYHNNGLAYTQDFTLFCTVSEGPGNAPALTVCVAKDARVRADFLYALNTKGPSGALRMIQLLLSYEDPQVTKIRHNDVSLDLLRRRLAMKLMSRGKPTEVEPAVEPVADCEQESEAPRPSCEAPRLISGLSINHRV
jgi:hypothetical protein